MRSIRSGLIQSLAGFLCASALSCVVPQAQYDTLSTQYSAEQKRTGQLQAQMGELNQRLTEAQKTVTLLETRLREQEQELLGKQQALDARLATLAEAEYQSGVTQSEREAAEALVQQLRTELGRVAGHLATLSQAKEQLATERDQMALELTQLKERVTVLQAESLQALARAELVRDLAAQLGEPLQKKHLQLAVEPSGVWIKLPAAALFEGSTGALSRQGKQVLGQVAVPLRARSTRVQISEWAPARSKADRKVHIRQVAGALHGAGVELEQLTMQDIGSDTPSAKSSAAPEMRLKVWRDSGAATQLSQGEP
jgi:predicted  nucleic acid-binding Zn-ribbon protein